MSQVSVCDRRTKKTVAPSYEAIPDWSLFEQSGAIYLKTEENNGHCPAFGIDNAGLPHLWYGDPEMYAQWKCIPRPDLKLTLVLENV